MDGSTPMLIERLSKPKAKTDRPTSQVVQLPSIGQGVPTKLHTERRPRPPNRLSAAEPTPRAYSVKPVATENFFVGQTRQ